MQVILLERVESLGALGDVVKVRPGYARNFLLPQGKALRATDGNLKAFETRRADIEAKNAETRANAEQSASDLDGASFVLIRSAGDTGQLYGSVSARDIAEAVKAQGVSVDRRQVLLNAPIKTIGMHDVDVRLHPEVRVTVSVNVARSKEEAERQAAGENVLETALLEARAEADEAAREIAAAAAEAAADRGPGEE